MYAIKCHMTKAEREAFLADVHVGILCVDEPGRGPCALPIWYRYRDGRVEIGIKRSSLKGRLLAAAGRATMTVQNETPPFAYVSVEGPIEFGPMLEDDVDMAVRYLGEEWGPLYLQFNPLTPDDTFVYLTPEHWRTWDYTKMFE